MIFWFLASVFEASVKSARFAASVSATSFYSEKATSAASFGNGRITTTADAPTAPWVLAFRNHLKPKFQPVATVTASQTGIALPRALFSEAYTMNTGWRRRPRNVADSILAHHSRVNCRTELLRTTAIVGAKFEISCPNIESSYPQLHT